MSAKQLSPPTCVAPQTSHCRKVWESWMKACQGQPRSPYRTAVTDPPGEDQLAQGLENVLSSAFDFH